MSSCLFCENKEIKERIIVKNELVFAFPTNIPIVPGHVILCPVRHILGVNELTEQELRAVFEIIGKIKNAMGKAFGAEGFNFACNEGELAGQSVKHLHFHILPRKEGDTGITEYEPRKFLYRPGSRETTPESELKDVADILKKSLKL